MNAHVGMTLPLPGAGRERAYFIENLSVLLASGMSILEVLDALSADIRSGRMRRIITRMREDIESGVSLSRALGASGLFSAHAISLIRIGEESGRLSENLSLVAREEEKDRQFRSKIRSAMMYPVFVLTLTLVIGVGIAWFILPKLALVFSQLKLALPLLTRVLIGTGMFLGEWGSVVVPLFALCAAFGIYLVFFFPKTRHIGQTILFHIPGVRRLIKEIEIARFGYLLGTLLQAGLPVTEAISSLSQATYFREYRRLYEHIQKSVEEGHSFKNSFETYSHSRRLIPTPIQQLIIAGERSGTLSDALLKVHETYEAKTDTTTKDLTTILEPILLVIVWLGVVGVALAVILPIYSLVGGLQ